VDRDCQAKEEERTGKRIWHPAAAASGKITPQELPSTLQPTGTNEVLRIINPAIMAHEMVRENQYFFNIFGTSLKKLLFCTSLTVALQVMFKENIWARMETLMGIASPPKKKKKNGIHLMFSKNDQKSSLCPSRYSKRVYATVPDPKKTTTVANQTSKLCM
jgi:hypothetical protein